MTQSFFKCIDDLHKLLMTRFIIVVYAKRLCGHPKKKIEFSGFIIHWVLGNMTLMCLCL